MSANRYLQVYRRHALSSNIYTLVYQRCCRNEDIRNILRPDEVGTTYFIQLTPESQERCNSSPVFNIDPPIAICINRPFQIDLGATDQDGDSLVYKFCDPKIGAGRDCPRTDRVRNRNLLR